MQSSAPKLTSEAIKRRVRELGEWFHNMDLRGVRTAPHHFLGDYPAVKWRRFADALPADLRGRTVLDIGCNAGFYAIEMKRRGADRVVGVDHDPDYLEQARFAAGVLGVEIEFRELSAYDIAALGERFDVVLFLGVLYHLRHPLLALDLIREQLTAFAGALEKSSEMQLFFFSPYFSSAEKADGLKRAVSGAEAELLNFLELLIDKQRMTEVFRVRRQFDAMWAKENKRLEVTVTSAVELDPAVVGRIGEEIERQTGQKVELASRVDDEILGGIVLQVGNKVLDASIRARLEKLRKSVAQAA